MKNILNLKLTPKRVALGGVLLVGLIILGTLRDLVYANLTNTGYYWSESLIFQNFWFWLLPNVLLIFYTLRHNLVSREKWINLIVLILFLSCLQLAFFVGTIMIYAAVADVSYRLITVFKSAVKEFAVIGLVVNTGLLFYLRFIAGKAVVEPESLTTHLTAKLGEKQFSILVDEVIYLTKDEAYVRVFTENNSYLISQNLKELEQILDGKTFIRIHKSTIVNRNFVHFTRSRKNGDYDITLSNAEIVRLSRRYRQSFFK